MSDTDNREVDERMLTFESRQTRLVADVEHVAERLVHIESVLFGPHPDRDGGLRKHMWIIETRLKEMMIWVRSMLIIAALWILLFGPQRWREIVSFFK